MIGAAIDAVTTVTAGREQRAQSRKAAVDQDPVAHQLPPRSGLRLNPAMKPVATRATMAQGISRGQRAFSGPPSLAQCMCRIVLICQVMRYPEMPGPTTAGSVARGVRRRFAQPGGHVAVALGDQWLKRSPVHGRGGRTSVWTSPSFGGAFTMSRLADLLA